MANRKLLDITPGYPLRESELWVTNKSETESGIMIRNSPSLYPTREWDVRWGAGERTAKAELIRDIVNYSKTNGLSFFWKEAFRTTRNRIYVATGTGAKRLFLLPVKDWEFMSVRVNGTEVYEGADYEILFESGQNGLDVVSFHDFIAAGQLVELDYTNGYLYPLVRAEYLDETLLPAGYNYHDLDITLRETKEDRSGIDIDEDMSLFMPLKGSTQAAIKSLDKGTGSATFTRATIGTYRGSDGLIKQAASGEIRQDWGEGKNICGPSEPSTLTEIPQKSNVTVEPFAWGYAFFKNAIVFGDNSVNRWGYLYTTIPKNSTISFSCYVKMDDGGVPVVGGDTSENDFGLTVDNAVVISPLPTVAYVGGGVYRVSATKLAAGIGGTSRHVGIVKYATNSARTFKATGYQAEFNSSATRYVKTNLATPRMRGVLGVLIEGQRTNLLTYSEAFNDASWTSVQVLWTSNAAIAPDGTITADKIKAQNIFGSHSVAKMITKSATSLPYVLSVFFRKAEFQKIRIRMDDGAGNGAYVDADVNDLSLGTPTVFGSGFSSPSATIRQYNSVSAGAYCRVSLTATTNTATDHWSRFILLDNSGATDYTGDDVSGVYLWGAQLEQASFPSSYIPTTSGTVPRNADSLTGTTSGNVLATVGSACMTFDESRHLDSQNATLFRPTILNNSRLQFRVDATQYIEVAYGGGSIVYETIAKTGAEAGRTYKFVGNWSSDGVRACVDGGSVASNTNTPAISLDSNFYIGPPAGEELYGHIKHLRVWSRALTDAEMQAVTTDA